MGITPLWTLRDAEPLVEPEQDIEEPQAQATQVEVQRAPVEASDPAPVAPARQHSPLSAPPYPVPPAPPVAPAPVRATESAWGDEPDAAPPTDDEIAQMDWVQLKAAIASCTRCGNCKPPRKPVYGAGDRSATWLVAAGAPNAADEQARTPLSGDAGKLLDNMLAAVDLTRERGAYVTYLIKCRPVSANGGDRAPTAEEAAACRPYLARERALTGAPMVLTLGQIAANALQDKALQESLGGSRGQVHAFGDAQLVATLHPGELLRRGADKALAWADLCLARAHDGRTN
jgi:DNA polymerase